MDETLPKVLPKTCNPSQRKHLRNRLAAARHPHMFYASDLKGAPKEVRAAARVLAKYRKEQERVIEALRNEFRKAENEATAAILFKSPDEALAAIAAYEELCRNARGRR